MNKERIVYNQQQAGGNITPAFLIGKSMDKNIYLENGYLNIEYILKYRVPFLFVVGGRGTGKTYGALKYTLENGVKFLYMRRTQAQADLINRAEFSPFKSITRDTGDIIISLPVTKYNSAFYRAKVEGDKTIPEGAPIGYTIALSTVSNLRGFDASDCELLIYDEFIPEKHERPLKNEAQAFWNAYETINRNRELTGAQPLKVLCLANANTITNPLFDALGVIDKVYAMEKSGQVVSINESRGYAIILLSESPISERKRDTALYKLTSGTDFASMAIDNSYNVADYTPQSINLIEYIPLITVEDITIYKHKSGAGYYVTRHASGGAISIDTRLYKKEWARLMIAADARGLVIYESLALKEVLTTI